MTTIQIKILEYIMAISQFEVKLHSYFNLLINGIQWLYSFSDISTY